MTVDPVPITDARAWHSQHSIGLNIDERERVPVLKIYRRPSVKLEFGVVQDGLPIPDAPLRDGRAAVV